MWFLWSSIGVLLVLKYKHLPKKLLGIQALRASHTSDVYARLIFGTTLRYFQIGHILGILKVRKGFRLF